MGLERAESARGLRIGAGALAGLSALVFGVICWIFLTTATGQRIDEIAFDGSALGRTKLWRFADPVLDVVSIGFVVLVLIIAATVAILRQRWLLIVQVGIVLVGANFTTQLLKRLVDRPELGIFGTAGTHPGMNTLPSGHTTVAMTAAIALLFVATPRLRSPVAIIGALYAAGTGVSTLVGGWHRASDVVAAMLVTGVFAGLALLLDRPRPRGARGGSAALIILGALGILAAIVSLWALITIWQSLGIHPVYDLVSNRTGLTRRDLLTAYSGGALGCVSVACAIVAAVVALLQQRGD
ncbi:MAG TPA: phosphatase PAP2 family protein [Actinomycetales bacterium]|nr:phosphatase PAP2 family protein [Actinomycetales bacterium]